MSDCELNDLIIKQLECPMCLDICSAPIYMCPNGHNVCSSCQPRVSECCICRGPKPTGRNRMAEELSATVLRPCSHSEEGCADRFCLRDLEEHLLSCQYGYQCQIHTGNKPCSWTGPLASLKDHATTSHKGRYRACPTDKPIAWQFNLLKTYNTVALFDLRGALFWCTMSFNAELKIFSGFVRHVGRDAEAAKYRCRFRFESGARELCYTSDVITLHEDALRRYSEMLCGEMVDAFADNHFLTCHVCLEDKE